MTRADIAVGLLGQNRPLNRQNRNAIFLKLFYDSNQFPGFCKHPICVLMETVSQTGEYGFRDDVFRKPLKILVHRRRHTVPVDQSRKGIPIDSPQA